MLAHKSNQLRHKVSRQYHLGVGILHACRRDRGAIREAVRHLLTHLTLLQLLRERISKRYIWGIEL